MIAAGKLRDLVTAERQRTVDDGYGNHTAEWRVRYASIPASVQPMKGGEQIRAARLAEVSPFEITIRRNASTLQIEPSDRLVNVRNKTVYQIKHILDLDGDLILTCEAVR